MAENFHYLFGPVPSRRLGRSLGVDLIPFKTCTMDCVFCQLGGTECTVSGRGDYAPVRDVLAELEHWKAEGGQADHVTLAGSGEPTLHLRFGEVLRWVKGHMETASVLLTNGSLLHLPEVRADAALADKVKVTLSAWDEASFRRIHRPAAGISFDLLLEGERAFRKQFSGELSVEVFIVDGINSEISAARRIAALVETIEPDRIDINTAVRPAAEAGVHAVSGEQLLALAALFGPKAVISPACAPAETAAEEILPEKVLALIRRHPVTAQQLALHFAVSVERANGLLEQMMVDGSLRAELRDDTLYYTVPPDR